jgi:hypothetical protein
MMRVPEVYGKAADAMKPVPKVCGNAETGPETPVPDVYGKTESDGYLANDTRYHDTGAYLFSRT